MFFSRKWLILLVAIFCVSVSAQDFDIMDNLSEFNLGVSSVAIEDTLKNAPWNLWRTGDTYYECKDDILRLELRGKGEFRVMCKQALDSESTGTVEFKVRFTGLGNGNVFMGAATLSPWMKFGTTAMFNGGRGLRFEANGKQLASVKDGEWHVIRVSWNFGDTWVEVDGTQLASKKLSAPASGGITPLIVFNSSGKPFTMDVDYIHFIGNRPKKQQTAQVKVAVPVPLLPPVLAEPSAAPVKVNATQKGASLENRYYKVEYDWSNGPARMSAITNKYTKRQMLLAPTPFFSVYYETKTLLQDFNVVDCKAAGNTLKLTLRSASKPVEAVYTIAADDSKELKSTLSLKNLASGPAVLSGVHPLVKGLRFSDDMKDDSFFYPFESGMAGALECQLGHVYGSTAHLQVMSGFSPKEGGSFYAYTADTTGNVKLLSMRRQSGDGDLEAQYEPIGQDDPLRTGPILNGQKGMSFAWRIPNEKVAAGATTALPAAVIGVGGSDWRDALASYGKFARTWWKKQVKTPQWYNECFSYLSGHPNSNMHLLSPRTFNGYFNKNTMKYSYSEQMQNWERNCVMEIAFWQTYERERSFLTTAEFFNQKEPGLDKYNWGNYEPNFWRGGLPALRNEIANVHKKGGRLMLYTFPETAGIGSEIDLLVNGAKLAMKESNGEYKTNYVGKGHGYFLCYYEPEFANKVAARFARLVKETGCDGVRLDTFARLYACYNPEHSHYDGTFKGVTPPERLGETLKTFKTVIGQANPEAVVSTEHAGCDYLTQFIDSYYAQNIAWNSDTGRWGPFRKLNAYQLVFNRFIFPEEKVWIMNAPDAAEHARMVIFNGCGVACTSTIVAPAAKTLEENSDTFGTSETPEIFVPTLNPIVFANKFTGAKTIYTLYNRGKDAFKGQVLKLPAAPGFHYVEIYKEAPCTLERANGADIVSVEIPANEVAAIAVFPELMKTSIKDFVLDIALAKKVDAPVVEIVYGEDNHFEAPPRYEFKSGDTLLKCPLKAEWKQIIVKLKSNNRLLDEVVISK